MNKVERRRGFIINVLFWAIIFALIYLFMTRAFGIVLPFLVAFIIAIILQKPLDWITRHSKIKRNFAAVFILVLILLIILGIITFLGVKIVTEVQGFINYLTNNIENIPQAITNIRDKIIGSMAFLPDGIEPTVKKYVADLFDNIQGNVKTSNFDFSMLLSPSAGVWNAAKHVPSFLLATVISIISCFFMTTNYRNIVNFIIRQFPEKHKNLLPDTKHSFFSTVGKMIRAYCLILLITFVELFAGFTILNLTGILDNQYTFFIALIIAVLDILPVLGTGAIMIPWALYSLIIGNTGLAIGLVCIYVVILVVRQYIEPKIVGGQIGLNPLVTLMAMYIGLKTVGVLGLFLVPLIVITLKGLQDDGKIHLWKSSKDVRQIKKDALAQAADVSVEFAMEDNDE